MFDIGANLTQESFQHDREQVLEESLAAGITEIMVTGASLTGSAEAVKIAESKNFLWATAGIHPHHAEEADEAGMAQIAELAMSDKVKAIGETGLDFFRDFSPREQQQEAFNHHIDLAVKTGLPMFLHERDAHPDFYNQLAPRREELSDVVVHCFTGNEEALQAYLELDCYIGITGWICDERRGQHLIPLVKQIPLDRLMIETDAPYLLPRTLRPKPKSRRNEPKYLPHICEFIAEILDMDSSELARTTRTNALRFFRL